MPLILELFLLACLLFFWGSCCIFITFVVMLIISPIVAIIFGIIKVNDDNKDVISDIIAMVTYIIVFVSGPIGIIYIG